jgi:multiple sugar transport system ATP-binding protein
MAHLITSGVSKRYDDVVAVNDMNLEIEDGEFISLVGPSGCGKSTTLEMIGGLTKPTSGTISIADKDVTHLAPKDRNIAMVFQNIALFPHLDVFDNISYGLRIRRLDDDEIEERVNDAAEILQLEGMLDRMPAELSGGQRQRVAIGRAIVRDPDVFLMDEPLANLDAKLRVHMRTELQRIQRELDVTTIYVTHDQEEAMTMSDRIAIIDAGELQQIDPPITCYDEPANTFVAGFIGSPSMNFFDGEVRDGVVDTDAFEVEWNPTDVPKVGPGDGVTLGVRPEDVHLAGGDADVSNPSRSITASVDVIEPVGNETYVYLVLGSASESETTVKFEEVGQSGQLLMRAESHVDFDEGDEIEVLFARENVHLFDSETGDAVVHELAQQTDRPVDM